MPMKFFVATSSCLWSKSLSTNASASSTYYGEPKCSNLFGWSK